MSDTVSIALLQGSGCRDLRAACASAGVPAEQQGWNPTMGTGFLAERYAA